MFPQLCFCHSDAVWGGFVSVPSQRGFNAAHTETLTLFPGYAVYLWMFLLYEKQHVYGLSMKAVTRSSTTVDPLPNSCWGKGLEIS